MHAEVTQTCHCLGECCVLTRLASCPQEAVGPRLHTLNGSFCVSQPGILMGSKHAAMSSSLQAVPPDISCSWCRTIQAFAAHYCCYVGVLVVFCCSVHNEATCTLGTDTPKACPDMAAACHCGALCIFHRLQCTQGTGTSDPASEHCEECTRKRKDKGAQQNACRLDLGRQRSQNVSQKAPN